MDAAARRRNEIEAKKAKLAELRKLREQRQQSIQSVQEVPLPSTNNPSLFGLPAADRKALDDLVNSLVGADTGSQGATQSTQSISGSVQAEAATQSVRPINEHSHGTRELHERASPSKGQDIMAIEPSEPLDLSPSQAVPTTTEITPFSPLPAKSVVTYTKATQTQTEEAEPISDTEEGGPEKTEEVYDDLVARLRKEIETEMQHKYEKDDKILATEAPSETSERVTRIDGDGTEPTESSIPAVGRELRTRIDLPDYTQDIDSEQVNTIEGTLTQIYEFSDASTEHRMITSISWSPKFSELVLASYSRSQRLNNSVQGLIHIWNARVPDRPEFTLTCQSEVQHAIFSPYHANLIVGGSYSGQIMIWDIKIKNQPILITPLTGKGHTFPITSLNIIGTKQASSIVSTSSDGTVCTWSPDILAQPQDVLELTLLPPSRVEEVNPTAVSHGLSDTSTFLVGTEDGNMHSVNRQERAGARAGIDPHVVYKGHAAMITGIDHHRCKGLLDLGDLVLTSSLDWTIRLWRLKSSSSVQSLDDQTRAVPALLEINGDDMVYDVKWSPTNPSVFASVDGLGNCQVFDLCRDIELPIAALVSTTVSNDQTVQITRRALNRVQWDLAGRHLAIGGVDGKVNVLAVPTSVSGKDGTSSEHWAQLKNRLKAIARR